CTVVFRACNLSHQSFVALRLLFFFVILPPPPTSTLFPYTTLFRSNWRVFCSISAFWLWTPCRSDRRIRCRFATGWMKPRRDVLRDRKSTRLNSSHDQISYAVFCLKKKKQMIINP